MSTHRLYNRSGGAVVLSPATNWLTAVNQAGSYSVGIGIKQSVRVLPKGFHHDTILVAGTGISNALHMLGDALLLKGGKKRSDPYKDFVLSHLGYWTDNGAFLGSSNPNHGGFANYEEALKAMKHEWSRLAIPFRYVCATRHRSSSPTHLSVCVCVCVLGGVNQCPFSGGRSLPYPLCSDSRALY